MLRLSQVFVVFLLVVSVAEPALANTENSTAVVATDSAESLPEIPFKRDEAVDEAIYFRVAMVLLLMLILSGLVIYGLKKVLLDKQLIKLPNSRIKILESRRISGKLSISLISVDEAEYLVSQSGSCHQMLRHQLSGSAGISELEVGEKKLG